MSDHSFSQYLRILGKGPKSRRSLTEQEAGEALTQILSGEVTERQLGAFLLLMRANGETTDELVGFVKTLRKAFACNEEGQVDLDWSAYAGKWRYPPYFLLSAKLLAQNGYRILLHGDAGQFDNRQYIEAFLRSLGIAQSDSLAEAKHEIKARNITYLSLTAFASPLREILHLKSELGVRTVFNTAVKLLNPLNAPYAMQGIFHRGVEQLHHAVAKATGIQNNLVFKGEGGEAEVRPDALTQLHFSQAGQAAMQTLSLAAIIDRQQRPKIWNDQDLILLWKGEKEDVYGEATVIATAAVALMLMENADAQNAQDQAKRFWQGRNV